MRLIAMIRDRAAVVVLVLLGACSGAPAEQPGEAGATPTPTATESASAQPSEPVPPNGSRWVGVDDLVFAVPLDWRIETNPCAAPDGNVVHFLGFASGRIRCGVDPTRGVDSLVLAPRGLAGMPGIRQLDRAFNVDGIVVRHRAAACRAGTNKSCRLAFGTDDLDTVFRLSYTGPDPRGFVAAMLDSARRLPKEQTTVPFVDFGSSADDAGRVLRRAGLKGQFADDQPRGLVAHTEPPVGSVVPRGSVVEVSFAVD